MIGGILSASPHGFRNRRRKFQVHSPGRQRHPGLRPLGRMRRRAPARSSTSRRCACSTRWRRSARWCAGASCAARIAGRCSVFAKSDMIHAQQKGYSPAEILRGLCDAVARNFKSSIVKGRQVQAPVALIGAVSQNAGVTRALCARPFRWPRATCSCRRSSPGAAPSARPCWKPRNRASARFWKSTGCASTNREVQVQDTPPAFQRKRGAVARAGGRSTCRRQRRRARSGLPGPGHRFGFDQRGGDRRIRHGDSRRLSAHRRAAHRSRAAGTGRSRAAVGQPPAKSAAWGLPDRAAS